MLRRAEKLRCTKEPFVEDVVPRWIESIHFDAFSGDEVKKAAEMQVWEKMVYVSGAPAKDGLIDLRMGPANKKGVCATCNGGITDCPGHFGYLKLALPVFHVGYFNSVLNILKCICKGCGRILLPDKECKEFLMKVRNPKADVHQKNMMMKKVRDKCKVPHKSSRCCCRCGRNNGSVAKGNSLLFVAENIENGSPGECVAGLSHLQEKASWQPMHSLTPLDVLSLFKKMPDDDCELLNLWVRPENLILTDVAIPPAPIRPSVYVGEGKSNEDGLTAILKDVIVTNSCLRENLEGSGLHQMSMIHWGYLQYHMVEYINSEAPSVDSKHRGLVQRLKGKQGRFRCNLSGKRVEFTGRTVISPDPNLKITEVAVPILMAQLLTYPERVTRHNIEKLRQCVRNGPSKHPGANFVTFPDGTRQHLKYGDKKNVANELKYGCVVERHLEDGDIVLFNRQPSLHRMSIMSHRARIMPWRTLRFNESVCNPYNADFDGDEMNLHVPQTEEARTEAFMLMGVQNNLVTPKNGEILVASTQDFLTSSFLITRKDTFYDRAAFSLMCTYIGDGMDAVDLPPPSLIKPIELWTGKQLFSVLIRPNARTRVFVNLIVKERIHIKDTETMCPCDGYVYFRNSDLICGQLGKVTLGNGNKNGLFSVLLRDYNSDIAASCMNRLAKLSSRWIGNHGFSIGIDDVQPGERLNQQKRMTIDVGYSRCSSFIKSYENPKLNLKPGANAAETLEVEITEVLNEIRKTAGDVCMKELHWRNSPLIMSQCGSKGSAINISQMIACVGQQSVGGRRAPNGFIDRTLPHFPIKSKTPAAKGFVANSFYTGLTATEFFFHTMGGREGLIDTAVKTAETGYMSRRLMKSLEDLSLYYDLSVRSANGGVVQFIYGDDGMDPAMMEGENGTPLNLDQLYNKVLATCPRRAHDSLLPLEIVDLINERLSKYDMSPEGGCSSAFKNSLSDFLFKRIAELRKTRTWLQLQEVRKEASSTMEAIAANISGISAQQLKIFMETCVSRYHKKKLEAGTAIGSIGAQSIGEPGTQMTLKTFHFAGVASMNVTLGVPRIKEIINASKTISTPIITATLFCDDKEESARIVKSEIERTLLGEVAEAVKIVLKSNQPYISVVLDQNQIQTLHMEDSFDSIKNSILNHRLLKSKVERITLHGKGKLRIFPRMADGKDQRKGQEKDKRKLYFELHSLISMLPKVIVKGISTVDHAVINCQRGKYNLLIEGTNLLAVMGTSGVDGSKTKSNHVMEIWHTLGIEAARQSVISEIQDTMKSHGMSIDARHMMLLADVMTYKGELLGITRFGMTKMKDSVLMLASFEKTSEHLFNASMNGRDDLIEGVSESIIMGVPMRLGTGLLKVRQSARWIGNHGFSIGIDDVQPIERLNQQKKMTIDDGYGGYSSFIELYENRKLKLRPGANAVETLEVEITELLNEIRKTAGDVCMKELHWRNSPLIMSQCGSKGSAINLSQMIACLGQQSVGGRRAPNGFIDRTLPHFPIKSKTPAAKGFVANSFYTGLTATEFFFHTMGGREGLVDTAVKTAETGYMSRRLMKSLEDLSLYYDQTVRSANGGVVQFIYGDDGMDPAKMEGENGTPLNLDQLYKKVMATCPCRPQDSLSPSEIICLINERLSKYDMTPEGGCSSAFKNLLLDFLHKRVAELRKTRIRLQLQEDHKETSSVMENIAANISGISAQQLKVFMETCISRYHKKKLEAGAAIGAIGAQSIGEPGTQMTLKTFHFAGVASMNVTLGVPRIKEIINAAKNISTPIISATLFCDDKEESARLVKSEIERTLLGEVAEAVKIVLKSNHPYISIVLDKERIKTLHMEDSLDSIKNSIVNHRNLKLKAEDITFHGKGNLRIFPRGRNVKGDNKDGSRLNFELHSLTSILPKVIVKGISTVDRAVINCQRGKYNLLVEGTNLLAVMGTPGVDASKTKSNHIMEIWQTLGIEAARQSIISEIQDTMKSHGMSIDARHMMLLADVMTYKGEVLGITRFGMTKMKDSVLMLASFEKTSEHLFNASFNRRDDQIEGVSECIIMGIPMQLGTGILKVRQRVEQLPELKYGPDPIIC